MDLSKLSKDLPATSNFEHVSVASLNVELADQFKTAAKSVTSLYNAGSRKETSKDTRDTKDSIDTKTAFSNAARAVASLYRAGTECTVLSMHKGYLDSLDDLLQVISNGEDIENWVLTKRAELVNYYNQKDARDTTSLSAPSLSPTSSPANETLASNPTSVSPGGVLHPAQSQSSNQNEEHSPSGFLTSPHSSADFADSDSERPFLGAFNMLLDLMTDLRFRPSFPPLSLTHRKRIGRLERRKPMVIHESAASSEESESEHMDTAEQKRRAKTVNTDIKRRKRDSLKSD